MSTQATHQTLSELSSGLYELASKGRVGQMSTGCKLETLDARPEILVKILLNLSPSARADLCSILTPTKET